MPAARRCNRTISRRTANCNFPRRLVEKNGISHRDLMPWLNDPYQAPPALAGVHDGQLALF